MKWPPRPPKSRKPLSVMPEQARTASATSENADTVTFSSLNSTSNFSSIRISNFRNVISLWLCDAVAWKNARFVYAAIGGWAVTHDRFGQQLDLGASLHHFLPPTTTQDLDNLPTACHAFFSLSHGHCASAVARSFLSSSPILPNYRSLGSN